MATVDGETVVLDAVSSKYLTVNGSGTVLLEALQGQTSKSDLVELLITEFGLDHDTALVDCSAFLDQLTSLEFLVD